MKLKQDVESSWQCPFVSVSEEKSEAQHAFCNVKEKRRKWRPPRSHSSHSLFPLMLPGNFEHTPMEVDKFAMLLYNKRALVPV